LNFKISQEDVVSLSHIQQRCKDGDNLTYYFLSETKEANLKKLSQAVEKLDRNIYIKKIRFSLEEKDYIYGINII
jgi:hypothetical protein